METEDQQVERIKDFWNEHGKGIVAGLVIGFALFYGWRYYDAQTIAKQEAASEAYSEVLARLASADETAIADAQKFVNEQAGTSYGNIAALELAQQAVNKGDLATAVSALQMVRDNTQGAMNAVATVRQARVLIAQDQYDMAITALQSIESVAGFAGIAAELRGDALLTKGDSAAARAAYEDALAVVDYNSPLAEIKLKSIPAES
ncbi:YfgM family protein [Pseudidiomarina aestuarii]|uniref:YfgM family protein n=1 Tax=Pseudidiomarina aestuarii TaxID=624146 RepID=UPI003A971628